ncbi:MAG: class I SAM-dependent methyltransferase [Hellea sp.]
MLRRLKQIVPLPLRSRLKWLGYAWQDAIGGARKKRVPPKRKTFIGGGDFIAVGDAFFGTLKRHGLTPDMDVLDVGCGQGRMARPMTEFLTGRYEGFDIDKSGITWCQDEYKDAPNFTFHHADVFNARYNKTGGVAAKDFRFPFDDNSFDRIFLTSVFTHMFKDDVENYLSEIARVLKPGGKCLATWFLLDEISRESQHPVMNFAHDVDEVSRTTVKSNPEAAIAFDLEFARELYTKSGLKIEDIEYGKWGRPESQFDLQDMIVASK